MHNSLHTVGTCSSQKYLPLQVRKRFQPRQPQTALTRPCRLTPEVLALSAAKVSNHVEDQRHVNENSTEHRLRTRATKLCAWDGGTVDLSLELDTGVTGIDTTATASRALDLSRR
jgi:hypothetical protein